jgi:hypothetical protein
MHSPKRAVMAVSERFDELAPEELAMAAGGRYDGWACLDEVAAGAAAGAYATWYFGYGAGLGALGGAAAMYLVSPECRDD